MSDTPMPPETLAARPPFLDRVGIFVRQRYGLASDWRPYIFEVIEPLGNDSPGLMVTGAVTPLTTRGKRAGKPNWRAKDKATIKTLLVLYSEFEPWDDIPTPPQGGSHEPR